MNRKLLEFLQSLDANDSNEICDFLDGEPDAINQMIGEIYASKGWSPVPGSGMKTIAGMVGATTCHTPEEVAAAVADFWKEHDND